MKYDPEYPYRVAAKHRGVDKPFYLGFHRGCLTQAETFAATLADMGDETDFVIECVEIRKYTTDTDYAVLRKFNQ